MAFAIGFFLPEIKQAITMVAVIYTRITIISSLHLELKFLKHSETCTLIGNGYN